MSRFILRRLANLAAVWLGISLLAFAVGNVAPGDPAEILLERQQGVAPTAEAVERARRELGLDAPIPVRYLRWLGGALRGDFGRSFRTGQPVLRDLAQRFPATLELALAAFVLAILVALPLGVLAAAHHRTAIDHASRLLALLGASIPGFWASYLLILFFSVWLHWLPVAGRGGARHLALPAVALSLGFTATLARLVRASLLEELGQDYVRTARAKGLSEVAVLLRHALRNALIPIVTFSGTRLGHLLAGAAVIETIFAWPGLGKHIVDSIYDRDYPAIQGFVLFMGTVFVLLNLAVDLSYRWLDPRVRFGEHLRG